MKPFRLLQVGINEYAGSSKLNGCVNDVDAFTDALTRFNGRVTENRTFKDRWATAGRLRMGMRWLAKAQDRPVWIFQYSGHGTLVRDRNGDEAGRVDGALVPVDYSRSGMLLDDELGRLTDELPEGGKLILWLDSCFSGAAQRSWMPRSVARMMKQPVARFLDSGIRGANTTLKNYDPVKYLDVNDERSVLIATSQPNITAADAWIDGRWRGAGTHALLLGWQLAGRGASYLDVQTIANEWLADKGYQQRIVLGGRIENLQAPFLT